MISIKSLTLVTKGQIFNLSKAKQLCKQLKYNFCYSFKGKNSNQSISFFDKKLDEVNDKYLILEYNYSKNPHDQSAKTLDPIKNTYFPTYNFRYRLLYLSFFLLFALDSIAPGILGIYFSIRPDELNFNTIHKMYLHKDGKHCTIESIDKICTFNIKSIHGFFQDADVGILFFKVYDVDDYIFQFGISMTSYIYDLSLFSAIMNSNYILLKEDFNKKEYLEASQIEGKENEFKV